MTCLLTAYVSVTIHIIDLVLVANRAMTYVITTFTLVGAIIVICILGIICHVINALIVITAEYLHSDSYHQCKHSFCLHQVYLYCLWHCCACKVVIIIHNNHNKIIN